MEAKKGIPVSPGVCIGKVELIGQEEALEYTAMVGTTRRPAFGPCWIWMPPPCRWAQCGGVW